MKIADSIFYSLNGLFHEINIVNQNYYFYDTYGAHYPAYYIHLPSVFNFNDYSLIEEPS